VAAVDPQLRAHRAGGPHPRDARAAGPLLVIEICGPGSKRGRCAAEAVRRRVIRWR
jgi:hypothetical protein